MFYEGQLDDARHTMMISRTAASYDALVVTSARVTGFLRSGERVIGATVKDLESGREIEVKAKTTVNAAGVWTDEIQQMIGGQGTIPGDGVEGRARHHSAGSHRLGHRPDHRDREEPAVHHPVSRGATTSG